ncbi:MAG: serine/threonine protein kinase, partial [Myxococcales bacterium]|nr:serine/threonine protein kinase [Myxococcales bacterium]
MRICPTCGEVYPDRATRCRAHDAPLLDWDGSSDTHPALTTDVEGRAVAPETPLELRVVAGEISPTSLHVGRVEVARGDTPRVMVAGDTPRSRAPSLGRVLGGRYRLGPQLGVGGYGAVFAATDEQTGARVAIKVLSPAAAQSPELLTRFHREAIAASRARHPHVVEVSDFDVDVDGTQYIVMEHLDGNDLSKTLDEVGALSPVRALTIAAQCARGLAAVHRVGILHRDLKPANVFLVRHDGGAEVVKIIDFGISKLTRAAGDYTDVTSASKVVGTPCYMAPEQARGAPLDVRTDVYALGVMLFEMLVGERPFTGRAPIEVLTKHLQAPRVAPSTRRPELARCPGLDALVVTALAADPERRHASMVVFGEAMIACLRAIDPTAAAGVYVVTERMQGKSV